MIFGKNKKKLSTAEAELDLNNIPRHIGVIMDGNGRWAKQRSLPRSAGHKKGAQVLEAMGDYCSKIGVEAVTAYAFSTENWSRPQEEVDYLMNLLYEYLSDAKRRFAEKNMRFTVSGDVSAFTPKLQKAIEHAVEVTKNGTAITLNLALNYGGRDEILRAVKSIAGSVADGTLSSSEISGMDEAFFSRRLDTAALPEVDMILRPGGEKRLSNFLLWQAAYAELVYTDVFWPDFTTADINKAIAEYQSRSRRFGKVK